MPGMCGMLLGTYPYRSKTLWPICGGKWTADLYLFIWNLPAKFRLPKAYGFDTISCLTTSDEKRKRKITAKTKWLLRVTRDQKNVCDVRIAYWHTHARTHTDTHIDRSTKDASLSFFSKRKATKSNHIRETNGRQRVDQTADGSMTLPIALSARVKMIVWRWNIAAVSWIVTVYWRSELMYVYATKQSRRVLRSLNSVKWREREREREV